MNGPTTRSGAPRRRRPRTPPPRRGRVLAAVLLGVAVLLLAAACGGSSNRPTGSATTTAGTGATATVGTGATATVRTGSTAPAGTGATATGGTGGDPVATGASCTSRPGSVCVTDRARGHTVRLLTGWTLTLRLGAPGRTFGAPQLFGASSLQALGRPRHSGNETVASYRAVKPGTVMVRATERPRCNPGSVCPDYVSLWMLTVRVSRRP